MRKYLFGLFLIFGLFVMYGHAVDFDHSHQSYGRVLSRYVKNGLVDYNGLKSNPEQLDLYLTSLTTVSEKDFNQWSEEQQLAYLINLYNAQTLRLIIDHYPVNSIKDINEPWDTPLVTLHGNKVTLNELEHEIIRKNYDEPRIHFALVCAAMGCPNLPTEPFVSTNLDRQLDRQGRGLLSDSKKNYVDLANKTVYLSPIFEWYKEDFLRESDSVLLFLRPYFPNDISKKVSETDYKIEFTDYDWSLNDSSTMKK
ncbi:DUF547 domain-containing protein [Desulfobacterota bacterium AH_259_B03_O07]|nr:DUF547 domain-containing protein [Desulfobacterota bacterium AH_259_B03_O07]